MKLLKVVSAVIIPVTAYLLVKKLTESKPSITILITQEFDKVIAVDPNQLQMNFDETPSTDVYKDTELTKHSDDSQLQEYFGKAKKDNYPLEAVMSYKTK